MVRTLPSAFTAVVVVASLAVADTARAADIQLQAQTLKAGGQVLHTIARDVDGDGTNELIAVVREGRPSRPARSLVVFKAQKTGFASTPMMRISVPPRITGFDVCDVDVAPGPEIVAISSRGVEAWLRKPEGGFADPVVRAELRTSLAFADPMGAPPLPLCQKPRGALGVELWVPVADGVAVLEVRDGALVESAVLATKPIARHYIPDEFRGPRVRRDYGVLTELAFPRLESLDADADGDDDCYATLEDQVWLFLRDQGKLGPAPAARRAFELRTDDEWRADKNRLQVFLADVTGDKLPDAVAVKSTGSIADLNTSTSFFAGTGAKGFEEKPFNVRAGFGYAIPEGVIDLDGDGAAEILEPKLDTSAVAIARLVVTGTVEMEFFALRAKDKRVVEGEAMELLFKFDPGGAGVKGMLPLFGEDIDGDGLTDRVDLGLGDSVEIVRGARGAAVYEEDASFEADAFSTRKAAWYVPAAKKPASIVIFSPALKERGDEILVFWNKKAL